MCIPITGYGVQFAKQCRADQIAAANRSRLAATFRTSSRWSWGTRRCRAVAAVFAARMSRFADKEAPWMFSDGASWKG